MIFNSAENVEQTVKVELKRPIRTTSNQKCQMLESSIND